MLYLSEIADLEPGSDITVRVRYPNENDGEQVLDMCNDDLVKVADPKNCLEKQTSKIETLRMRMDRGRQNKNDLVAERDQLKKKLADI